MSQYLKDNESFTLKYPREIEGRRYESLTLRRPLVEDFLVLDEMSGTERQKEVFFQANLASVAPGVIKKLDYVDQVRLTTRLNSVFLEQAEMDK